MKKKSGAPADPNKIIPKKGWSTYTEPYLSPPPTPPQAVWKISKKKELGTFELHTYTTYSISDLPLPEGIKPEDVKFEFHDEGYIQDEDYNLRFFTEEIEEEENPKYAAEMKRYTAEKAKWDVAAAEHTADLKLWKAWKKQEEAAALEARLKAAEAMLKKHGRLK